ncbi:MULTISPECIES: hypothetical protein [Bacillus]|uniref:hypothetical protein n=1 Tax=Bacillus TaxID=1386 RepID=UPI0009B724A4|nr:MULTISPECIES: hypothetical protein [Bacillus]ARC67383.1 hypothetical protein B14_200172 [Bacillus licheniformis]ARW46208.1 hypothetical protein S100141_04990 [Bacillus licheniformis]MCY8577094.1 hypothetical protein [Bacillus haynesii]MDE1421814.1 hypothetical protein [Bacillus licheniformis]MEC0475819.1 hypothetical protein [Bacillus licheniformis]
MNSELAKLNPTALDYFKKELDLLKDVSLKSLIYNALAVAPQSFHDDEETQEIVKSAFYILKGILEARNVEGTVKDAMLGTVLLCDIMVNEFEDNMKDLHTVAVRKYLEDLRVDKDVQQQFWQNIMRGVESHEGPNGASPLLDSKPGTAEAEITYAFMIARMKFVKLDWEVINNETGNKR